MKQAGTVMTEAALQRLTVQHGAVIDMHTHAMPTQYARVTIPPYS